MYIYFYNFNINFNINILILISYKNNLFYIKKNIFVKKISQQKF